MDKEGFAKRLNMTLDTYYSGSSSGDKLQKDVAALFNVKQQTVSKWLTGQSYPRQEKLNEIAATLKCSPDWLLMGMDAPHLQVREDRERYNNISPAERDWLLDNYSSLNAVSRQAIKTLIEQLLKAEKAT